MFKCCWVDKVQRRRKDDGRAGEKRLWMGLGTCTQGGVFALDSADFAGRKMRALPPGPFSFLGLTPW